MAEIMHFISFDRLLEIVNFISHKTEKRKRENRQRIKMQFWVSNPKGTQTAKWRQSMRRRKQILKNTYSDMNTEGWDMKYEDIERLLQSDETEMELEIIGQSLIRYRNGKRNYFVWKWSYVHILSGYERGILHRTGNQSEQKIWFLKRKKLFVRQKTLKSKYLTR